MKRTATAALCLALALSGCDRKAHIALVGPIEAQNLAGDMRVQLHRAAESVQRAIMADTDEAAAEFAREARDASGVLASDQKALAPILAQIGWSEEKRLAQEFDAAFAKIQELDATLLALAVENTNAKAQRLSFGPAREAADTLRDLVESAVRTAPALRAELLAARVQLAVRDAQALQAPHIAEADDDAMAKLEEQMAGAELAARDALAELATVVGASAAADIAAAREQLERFSQIQREIIALSRKNSDVRSLAVALGERRTQTAAADAALSGLADEFSRHGREATR